ncbi:hypothetical protein PAHA111176_04340 [Parendozoicomonas haliclonae]|uniref:Uncharacterized protein n=1 Tax=Parendozoicomonas haliclonae TaxID=1960125 RepID=A0A1X7AK13_9GAMM|nr:hypothetical protein EHSB41UT_02231 [Parendozoicomonas haliclonae]
MNSDRLMAVYIGYGLVTNNDDKQLLGYPNPTCVNQRWQKIEIILTLSKRQ